MKMVKPKKHLGQHFLKDKAIAQQIVSQITQHQAYTQLLEIGPGTGVLSDFLLAQSNFKTYLLDIDSESIAFLRKRYATHHSQIIEGDFLKADLSQWFQEPFGIIGNFPYNISSQIFFKILDYRNQIPEVVCMLQKEVAERIASPPKRKDYGILSVFLQAYYDIDYLFTVEADVFDPPPKVRSGVIRLRRNKVNKLNCDEKAFFKIVKQGFNNRRKTLRNALKPLGIPAELLRNELLDKRAEELSVAMFEQLTNWMQRDTI